MTKYQKLLGFFLACIIFIIACWACWLFGRRSAFPVDPPGITVKVDTLIVRDTLRILDPVETERVVTKYVEVPVHQTTTVRDTVFVQLPVEVVTYQGEDYRAVVSGVIPKLEEIDVFPKTVTITRVESVRKRWSAGLTVGPGILYDGRIHGGVGIVAGLQYNF